MCDSHEGNSFGVKERAVPVDEAVGMALAHDITEIRPGGFKGRAFKKGHVVRQEDIDHLKRLGKERLSLLSLADGELHEDDAAPTLAKALMGEGVRIQGEPKEGKINIVADRDGLLRIDGDALVRFNMLGDVMCATRHTNSLVKKDQVVAGTRAIPLVVRKSIVDKAVKISEQAKGRGIIEVKELRKPRAGVVITGNEVYHGRIKDAFAPVISRKIEEYGGEIVGVYYAPDDEQYIEDRLRELLRAGADLLIATGGMSVDPDDVTRFAIRRLGAREITYGSAALPGAMVLVGYVPIADCGLRNAEFKKGPRHHAESAIPNPQSEMVPILGIPACGMYHKTTVFDLVLPRILAGERIGRRELAELGHGGLCMQCKVCRYPVCPFGKC